MGCGAATLKCLFITINVIFGILSVILIVGAITHSSKESPLPSTPISIVDSSLLLLLTIVGCCGVSHKNIWILWTYTALMGITALYHIYVLFRSIQWNVVEFTHETIDDDWQFLLRGNGEKMYNMQDKYKCCGKDSAQDYERANMPIPPSCYHDNIINQDGCYKVLADLYLILKKFVYYSIGTLLIVELLGVALAAFLAIRFTNIERRSRY